MKYKDLNADLRSQMPIASRKALSISLLIVLLLALTSVEVTVKPIQYVEYQTPIEVENIPVTKKKVEKKKIERPKNIIPDPGLPKDKDGSGDFGKSEIVSAPDYVPPLLEEEEPVWFPQLDEIPVEIYKVQPEYPEIARKSGTEGTVIVEFIIGKDGRVEDAWVYQSRPEGMFDQAALDAIMQWEFKPAMQNGKTVRVRYQVPIFFKLR